MGKHYRLRFFRDDTDELQSVERLITARLSDGVGLSKPFKISRKTFVAIECKEPVLQHISEVLYKETGTIKTAEEIFNQPGKSKALSQQEFKKEHKDELVEVTDIYRLKHSYYVVPSTDLNKKFEIIRVARGFSDHHLLNDYSKFDRVFEGVSGCPEGKESLTSVVSAGSFGRVKSIYLKSQEDTQKSYEYVVKVLDKKNSLDSISKEIEILKRIGSHVHDFQHGENTYVIMKKLPDGYKPAAFGTLLKTFPQILFTDKKELFISYMHKLLQSVEDFHTNTSHAHCDLKPANLFIDFSKLRDPGSPALLIDFGSAVKLNEKDILKQYSKGYVHPERINFENNKHTCKPEWDYYAIGKMILKDIADIEEHCTAKEKLELELQDIKNILKNGLISSADVANFKQQLNNLNSTIQHTKR